MEFGGWEMPLQYEGVIVEHRAVRTAVGIFDVSHLGKLKIAGRTAEAVLERALTAHVGGLEVGRATYSLVLAADGGVIDDVFVYRLSEDEWMVVPNAANVGAVAGAVADAGGEVVDQWNTYSILAIQGPDSFEVFDKVFPESGVTELALHRFKHIDVFGQDGLVARTGYTGERGFELYAPVEVAPTAFESLLDAGATPVGLGARDTLRLEMGYALYGHELSLDINPLEAGLGWVLAWDTPFRGRDALIAVRDAGPARRLCGIRCLDRGVPRQGFAVYQGELVVGEVTSGNFSPTLETGIALALGPARTLPEVGEHVSIQARGRILRGDIVKPPFIRKGRGN